MEISEINNYLFKKNLFDLFTAQLKKDFEGAGANAGFTETLPGAFEELTEVIARELKIISNHSSTLISSLLYRIDINEIQIRDYSLKNTRPDFERTLAELIIKRVLQKVIFKLRFSEKNH